MKSYWKKKWVWPWARGAPRNLGFPFNIFAMAEASDFKFGLQLGFTKAHRKKWRWPWARGAPQNFGVPCNISATAGASDFKFGMQLEFAKTHH